MANLLFEQVRLNKREAKDLVDTFFAEINSALERGESVKLTGFGNFQLRDKVSRPGRNPKTGVDTRETRGHFPGQSEAQGNGRRLRPINTAPARRAIVPMATTYKWQFAPRFRRAAFGWKSTTPIQRIKEALEGAMLFLEKLAPAIEQVDSSSGGIGSAVNRAIETLVPIIAKADVSRAVCEKWLGRL